MMVEAVTTTTVLVAVGAALVTLAVVSVALFARRRRLQSGSSQELLGVVSEMNTRMEGMIRALSESLESAQEEGRRNRYVSELAGSIDLDEVLARTLEAGGAVPGVDAALVSVAGNGDKPIVATLGLSAEEAHRQVISGPPDGHEARAISLVYQYPPSLAGAADLVHTGLAVPVPGEAASIGFLAVYSRSSDHRFAEEEIRQLGAISNRPVGQAGRLSVSAGIAQLADDDDPTTFFERADEALYRAKEHGKAQVVAYGALGAANDEPPEANGQPLTSAQ